MHGGEANVWWTLATGAHWSHSALPCHWSITTDTHTAMGDPKMETFVFISCQYFGYYMKFEKKFRVCNSMIGFSKKKKLSDIPEQQLGDNNID